MCTCVCVFAWLYVCVYMCACVYVFICVSVCARACVCAAHAITVALCMFSEISSGGAGGRKNNKWMWDLFEVCEK